MSKYLSSLPQETRQLITLVSHIARTRQTRVYLVGGCVRDILLGRAHAVPDLDFSVEGNGIAFAETVARRLRVPLVRHARFGTASLAAGSMRLDFASTRRESYPQPAELPVVSPGTIIDDLRRRDFTINALALDLRSGSGPRLIDVCSGKDDCSRGLVRVLHDASFIDDPTRILRAIRFEQRLRFRIEAHTLHLLKQAAGAGLLRRLNPQRVRDEMILMLKEESVARAFARCASLLDMFFVSPGLRITKKTAVFSRALARQAAWFERTYAHRRRLDAWLLHLIALVDNLPDSRTQALLARLGFRRGECIRVMSYKRLAARAGSVLSRSTMSGAAVSEILEPLSYETILAIRARYPRARRHIDAFFAVYNDVRVRVSGSDIRAYGIAPGSVYKKLLARILRERLNGRLETREEELAFIEKFARKLPNQ